MKYIKNKEDLKQFLKENSILIEYTKDNLGFKNGVVVAIGPGRLGWSKVSTEDYIVRDPHTLRGIPAWANYEDYFLDKVDSEYELRIFAAMAIAMQERNSSVGLRVPAFNRFKALQKAINMAISLPSELEAPYSLENACDEIYVRSMVYFK